MKRTAENSAAYIDTVPKAATELRRLHLALGAQAVELTQAYLTAQLAGREGVSWRWSPHLVPERAAILDPAIRIGNDVELGAYFLPFRERAAQFRLTDLGEPEGNNFTVERQGVGLFRPGEKYWVRGEEVLRAGYTSHQAFAPWEGGISGTITDLDTNNYAPVDGEDAVLFKKLTRLITDVSFYEIPLADPEEG